MGFRFASLFFNTSSASDIIRIMRILAVGIATLDIINIVETYPREDQEVRASHQRLCRGCNATNTLVVLSQLGQQCEWAGVMTDDGDSQHVLADLERHRVGVGYYDLYPGGKTPTSYVVLSAATGSRTIVHYRDLPEFSAESFEKVPLDQFDWVHFEGRNLPELSPMLRKVSQRGIPCSLEIEKPREGIEALFGIPDVLLLSRAYAGAKGFGEPVDLLRWLAPKIAGNVSAFLA